jgi:hypothetical protein
MSTRKNASGCEKLKKIIIIIIIIIEFLKGSLNKFVITNKQNINDNLVEKQINEQKNHKKS